MPGLAGSLAAASSRVLPGFAVSAAAGDSSGADAADPDLPDSDVDGDACFPVGRSSFFDPAAFDLPADPDVSAVFDFACSALLSAASADDRESAAPPPSSAVAP